MLIQLMMSPGGQRVVTQELCRLSKRRLRPYTLPRVKSGDSCENGDTSSLFTYNSPGTDRTYSFLTCHSYGMNHVYVLSTHRPYGVNQAYMFPSCHSYAMNRTYMFPTCRMALSYVYVSLLSYGMNHQSRLLTHDSCGINHVHISRCPWLVEEL